MRLRRHRHRRDHRRRTATADSRPAWTDAVYVSAALLTTVGLLDRRRRSPGRLVAQLQRQAAIDPLTGLATRRVLDHAAQSALSGAASGEGTALILIDVDDFKSVNDRYGHPAGDEVLIQLAELLIDGCRDDDIVSRMGGDEIALLLPGCSAETPWSARRPDHVGRPGAPVPPARRQAALDLGQRGARPRTDPRRRRPFAVRGRRCRAVRGEAGRPKPVRRTAPAADQLTMRMSVGDGPPRTKLTRRSTRRLFAIYAVVSLVPVVVLGLVLLQLLASQSDSQGLAEGTAGPPHPARGDRAAARRQRPAAAALTPDETAALTSSVDRIVQNGQVVRLRLRDLDGKVVYAYGDDVRRHRTDDDEALEAAHGETMAGLTYLNRDDAGATGRPGTARRRGLRAARSRRRPARGSASSSSTCPTPRSPPTSRDGQSTVTVVLGVGLLAVWAACSRCRCRSPAGCGARPDSTPCWPTTTR